MGRIILRIISASPAVAPSPRTAWNATGGWLNGRSPGSTASSAWRSATSTELTSFWPSCSLALQLGCALISLRFLGEPHPTTSNHIQLARTVDLDRRARPLLHSGHDHQENGQ